MYEEYKVNVETLYIYICICNHNFISENLLPNDDLLWSCESLMEIHLLSYS